jgi:hypothetical protein
LFVLCLLLLVLTNNNRVVLPAGARHVLQVRNDDANNQQSLVEPHVVKMQLATKRKDCQPQEDSEFMCDPAWLTSSR